MPEDKIFVDTNIIIYAFDVTAGKKHKVAVNILTDLWNSGMGVISTQVLQEFFVNVTQKIPRPIDRKLAREIVRDFLKWHVVVNNGDSILDGIDICEKYKYSFWDSMIIGAAIKSGSTFLMSEDLQDGQVIGGVTITNPFKE
ncbi:PIN domain-containing protein [Thermodesulfobacteriota bacterium]